MSKYVINDSTLIGIGDAIRAKGGTSDKILVSDLATAITNLPTEGGSGGGLPSEITTSFAYFNNYGHNDWICDLGQPITFIQKQDGMGMSSFFMNSSVIDASNLTFIVTEFTSNQAFNGCIYMEKLPKLYVTTKRGNNLNQWFNYCRQLRNIPNDYLQRKTATGEPLGETWIDSIAVNNSTYIFRGCWSLRDIPDLTGIYYNVANGNYSQMFSECYSLDEITTFIMPMSSSLTTTSNKFSDTFYKCSRLKRLVFPTQADGTPYVCSWKSQTIDLSSYVGYASSSSDICSCNSGCGEDKWIKDDATYQALKDDEDCWTTDINYSRYNHDSAVETINSLPDTSAYGTNIIQFKGAAGALTDGGAINTLTEEEIAVATAKGWTVTLV